MLDENTFDAPWGRSLKLTTALSVTVLSAVFLSGVVARPNELPQWKIGLLGIPAGLIGITALFSIRNYRIIENRMFVQRVGWQTTVNLSSLVSAEVDPDAMSKSIRLFGNGGLFCFAGWFRNKRLGRFRAFATDPKRAVVLRFPKRIVVVTPDDPHGFCERIEEVLQK